MTSVVNSAARRAYIEGHLQMCRDGAARSLIQMGRWLCQAKEEQVVPHGEWTTWVATHAGVNERTAQRLMRIAREIPEGSSLEGLGPAKLEELIKLPAPEREEIAEQISAETKSVREVRDEVAVLRSERDEALRMLRSTKEAAQNEKKAAVEAASAAAEQRISDLRDKLHRRESDRDNLHRQNLALIDQIKALEARGAQLDENAAERLRALEEENDRLADEIDRMRLEQVQEDRGGAGARILSAIGGMIAMVGRDPAALRADPDLIRSEERPILRDKVRVVRAWADAMEEVL